MKNQNKKYVVVIDKLPKNYPTHLHAADFWENLGRAVATYGFLEEVLKKAIFALTATQNYPSQEELEKAYAGWGSKLERTLTGQLFKLAESFGAEAKITAESAEEKDSIDMLVDKIKNANKYRNVLCHGSWNTPPESGKSTPFFINHNREIFDMAIDVSFLIQIQDHVKELACHVMNTVTSKGWQFPGSNGPGKKI